MIVEGRHSFASNNGEVNVTKLDKITNNKSKCIVGWVIYRCNCSSRPSLIDRAIHNSLLNKLPQFNENGNDKDLIFGLFTENNNVDHINSIEYSFYRWTDKKQLQLIHVDVVNLQSTSLVPYQLMPMAPLPHNSALYSDIIQHSKTSFFDSSGDLKQSKDMEELCKAFLERFEPLKAELASTYKSIVDTDNSIKRLREQLFSQNSESKDVTLVEEDKLIDLTAGSPQTLEKEDNQVTPDPSYSLLDAPVPNITDEVEMFL
jgi:hypothetical protein